MALATCKECGHQVSTEAMRCPQCGASGPQRSKITTIIFAAIVIAALLIGGGMAIAQAWNASSALDNSTGK